MYEMDSRETVVLAKLYELVGKYLNVVLNQIENPSIILRCAGLSSLDNKYAEKLTPYVFNGIWKNPNPIYDPIGAGFNICLEIESNQIALISFFGEIFDRITKMDEGDFKTINLYLQVIGYELHRDLTEDDYGDEFYKFELIPLSSGVIKRQKENSYLIQNLRISNPNLIHYYEEAISNYGNSEFKSCIDNCRTLFESYFKSMGGNYASGILKITGEKIVDNNNSLSTINSIFNYWIKNKKGANRYRLFVTVYSAMSGLSVHGDAVPSQQDALMFLRITEDILIWCFQVNHSA